MRRAIALVALIIVGGMAIAIIRAISPSSPHPSSAATDRPVKPPEPPPAPPPAPPTAATAREAALVALRGLLGSPSARIVRDGALALARTCDGQATAALLEVRKAEESELARTKIDYTLARCGDREAHGRLKAGLANERRDVKADSARALVDLGDDAGAGFLRALLGVTQHRLSAAEALVPRKDPRAISVLNQVRGDAGASEDDRLRAAIALAWAGDAMVAETLRGALADARFRPAAAAALTQLGDAAGRDALVADLAIPSLRVDAARALRRLAPGADVTALLPGLLAGLAAERDASQASAAEALLVLTGPATDAERP